MTTSDAPIVIVVCRANRIRSPIAEHLLRAHLQRAGIDWLVSSCGTHARAGIGMDPAAQALLTKRGVVVADSWRTTSLHRDLLQNADLVLTAEPRQRSAVVEICPRALHNTFALRQFARIAERAGRLPADIRRGEPEALLTAVTHARALQPVSAEDDSIPDPAGHSHARLLSAAELIEHSTATIARALASSKL